MAAAERKTIMVVDDTEDLLSVLKRRLESWGYDAITSTNGEEALEIVEKRPVHLILLDVMMPKMKGREVCARLKANPRTRHIPVIFLTALGLADHIKAGMELNAEDYIIKPFEPVELKERIAVVLARHMAEAKKKES